MKIAVVHDYIKEYGGAERVLEALHDIWPEADVYTTVYLPEFLGPHADRFKNWKIITSNLQKIPFVHKLISPIRLLTPWVFENWDFTGYDLIIVSATGAYFPNLIVRKPWTTHITYCHTPPRYLYGYPTARNWKKYPAVKLIGEVVNHNLRQTDFLSYQRPDYIIANSEETKRRIEKFYRRDSIVIYPPGNINAKSKTQKAKLQFKNKEYFLAGGRLARAKRIDLAIKACNKLKLPLKLFGRGFADYGQELRNMAGDTIEFMGEVSDEELEKLYQGAKALIYPPEMEDFGIVPVEAQSYGVPVIGLNQGGVKETVIDGKTGILFDKPDPDSLVTAIRRFNKLSFDPEDCFAQASKFSKERFKKEIVDYINSKHKNQTSNYARITRG